MNWIIKILGGWYAKFLVRTKSSIFSTKEGVEFLEEYAESEVKNHIFSTHARFKGYRLIQSYKDSKKKSDTLFILGSGESVNELSKENWRHIKSKNILGLNYSFVHPVVPDYHFMEMIDLPEMQDFFCEVAAKNYKDVDIFFQYKHIIKSKFNLDRYLYSDRLYVHVPHLFPTVYSEILEMYLKELKRTKGVVLSDLVHHNSHIGCAVMFAQALGYKNIVMLGIDLNGGDYFTAKKDNGSVFQFNSLYEKINLLREIHFKKTKEYTNSIHPTIDKNLMKQRGGVLMDEYFKVYKKVFIEGEGVNLYVGSETSTLSKFLPVYQFES